MQGPLDKQMLSLSQYISLHCGSLLDSSSREVITAGKRVEVAKEQVAVYIDDCGCPKFKMVIFSFNIFPLSNLFNLFFISY